MGVAAWFLLIGGLLLAVGLSADLVRRLPITSAIIYLAVGVVVGPTALNAFHFNPLTQSALLEVLTEIAVLLSLFTAGTKMPIPVRLRRWRTPILLAFVAMAMSVGLMAVFSHFALGLGWGAAILLGAILAPTDPVLATDIQSRHPGDRDRLRFTLTCEAGMNDGSAFPFVMLGMGLMGLHDLGDGGMNWLLIDVGWATVGGIGLGIAAGAGLGRFVHYLRQTHRLNHMFDEFIGLGLIGVVYGIGLYMGVWGFLAVFVAAVTLRETECRLTGDTGATAITPPVSRVTDGSLAFKEQLERLSELVLVFLVGGTLFLNSWSIPAVATAAFLFLVARPVSVLLTSMFTRMPWRKRIMAGWFGVRGIGSLYYLMYAIQHGVAEETAVDLIHYTLIVITLSIIVHGLTVKPMLARLTRPRAVEGALT